MAAAQPNSNLTYIFLLYIYTPNIIKIDEIFQKLLNGNETSGRTDGRTDGQTDGRTDGRTDGQG